MTVTRTSTATRMSDPSLWAIVLSNLLTLILAYTQAWPVSQILWIYWAQSIVIGIANVIRILRLKEFSTKGLKMNGRPVSETASSKRKVAVFFAFHYGFFHLSYAAFLFIDNPTEELSTVDIWLLLLVIGSFVVSHFYSLMFNAGTDFKSKKPNLGMLMFYPYLRIIPMHLTIIFGSMMGGKRSSCLWY